MRYRDFGRTGLRISELVFGGGWVGGLLIHESDEVKRAAIGRAMDGGINWIDTAPLYGQGQSEQALGWLLREVEAQPYLSTKIRLDTERLDDIAGQMERSLEASLTRLQRGSVDLLQLHNPIAAETSGDSIGPRQVLGSGGAAEGLERLREQGLTRFIGLTALGDGPACREAIDSGRFDSAQVYYNMLNPSAGRDMPSGWGGQDFNGLIASCKAQGTGVMAIRVFAAGVLASDRRHGREVVVTRASELALEEARAAAALAALGLDESGATSHGSRAQTALRFVLANADLACAVFGLAELAHLEEALAAAEAGPLPPAALEVLDGVYERNFGPS